MKQLPPAPSRYALKDQDLIRRILGEGLDDTLTRIKTLESRPATPPPGNGDNALKFGLANYGPHIGTGPGLRTTAPIYKFIQQLGVAPTDINNLIAISDELDITFMFSPAGGRASYIDANGIFSRGMYETRVRRFEANATLADAIDRKRVLLWVMDEANHPSFHGTCDPDDVNWTGNLHKSIWPGSLTFVRMGTSTMLTGWNSQGIPAGGWTGIDYAWEQRSSQHNDTLEHYYTTRKAQLLNVELGMIPGFNWWAGGLEPGESLNGVQACWDVNLNGQATSVVTGLNNGGTAHGDLETVACSNYGDSNRTIVSPDFLRAWAQVVVQDVDAPFTMLWQWPEAGSMTATTEARAMSFANRQDYIDALDDVLNTLNTRSVWRGWREAKPGDPLP